ncbi:MAG: hypothetical protein ABMA64_24230 [Myxococcota bacterium]
MSPAAIVEAAQKRRWDEVRRGAAAHARGPGSEPLVAALAGEDVIPVLEALADLLVDRGAEELAAKLDAARFTEAARRLEQSPTEAARVAAGLAAADLGDGSAPAAAPVWYARALDLLGGVPGVDGARHRALVHSRAGNQAEEAQDRPAAEAHYRAALDELRPHAEGGDPRVLRGLQVDLGNLSALLADPEVGPDEHTWEAIAVGRRLAADPAADTDVLVDLAEQLALVVEFAADPDQARVWAAEVVELWERVERIAPDPGASAALGEARAVLAALEA